MKDQKKIKFKIVIIILTLETIIINKSFNAPEFQL